MEFVEVDTQSRVQQVAGLATAIWNQAYKTILSQQQIDYMLENFQSCQAIEKQIDEDGYLYYLVCKDAEIAGYLGLQPKEGKLFLSKVYLLEKWQGKNLTKPIFTFIEEVAKNNNSSSIWLTVNKGNHRAIGAYKKQGFIQLKEQVSDIGNGYIMDDYVMEKQLI